MAEVRALLPDRTTSSDHASTQKGHWLTATRIATPMSQWPAYRADRSSWGLDALGMTLVEVETDEGHVGVAPTLGGPPLAYLVERHLARFIEGREVTREGIAEAWEQMFRASLYYGRKGLVLHAVSAIDLALWDLLGRVQDQPVWALAGEPVQRELIAYATGPRPDLARTLGFRGAKLPLPASGAEAVKGHAENVALFRQMREACGSPDVFFLAYDAYMSMDHASARTLAEELRGDGLAWLEEPLLPDDYGGYADLRAALGGSPPVAGGEHEATRWGFELLLAGGCVDIVQPELTWCGGFTTGLDVLRLAAEHDVTVVPHGAGVYGYHLAVLSDRTPYVEFPMLHPEALEPVPVFAPLLVGETLPVGGVVAVGDAPGFGLDRSPDLAVIRPFPERI